MKRKSRWMTWIIAESAKAQAPLPWACGRRRAGQRPGRRAARV
ncbi:MAG: hypothetical protein ACP5EN_14260 [Rhodovulum sp.]